jgi:putative ABC transport system permease protein
MDKRKQLLFFIAGVWRDYARQSGTMAMDRADYLRLTGDHAPATWHCGRDGGTDLAQLQQAPRAGRARCWPRGPRRGRRSRAGIRLGRAIRERSLRIFDRSFAVTYWLQAVAIGIGLFGVAASFSAQVLARRKEFGLLAHLGLTRRQILAVVAGEGAAWTAWALAGGCCWAWPCHLCWCTWSTRKAFTGPWTCACPQPACWHCAPWWWPQAP